MKKLISVVLAVVMLFSMAIPASAAWGFSSSNKNPIIYIRGNGNIIFDNDGEQAYPLTMTADVMTTTLVDALMDDFVKAVTLGKWDAYYEAFETEVAKIYERSVLDENGDIANGSGINGWYYYLNDVNMNSNYLKADGNSDLFDYTFWYDWRLDPFEIADQLDDYIDHVLAVTGATKVSIVGKCLGGSFLLGYLAKYGGSKISRVAFDCTVGGGCEEASDLFSGKANVDFEALERDFTDQSFEETNKAEPDSSQIVLTNFIKATLNVVNETDRLHLTEKAVNDIYKKLSTELTPRLCMATFGTWPGYWTNVTKESYEEAKNLIFYGACEDYAEKYKGLIEKLDRYDELVRQRIPELLSSIKDSGVDFGVLSKYGYQLSPLIDSNEMLGDALVSLKSSSFGATCSTVNGTLSDEYIAQRQQDGYGKYIAPDKQVDASTCVFPDSTWFIKGMTHENWADCNDQLVYTILTSKEPLTVDSMEQYPQFMIYDDDADNIYPMTAENCNVTNWNASEIATHDFKEYVKSVFEWLKAFISLIVNKIVNRAA